MPSADGDQARRGVAVAVAGLALCAFAVLLAWGASPYAGYLRHDQAIDGSAVEQGSSLALFLGGWLFMSTAMMLPTATRLLHDFALTVRRRPERRRLQAIVVAGFLATWLATGYVFRAVDIGVHLLVGSVAWLEQRPELLGAGVLVGAGLFQFSGLHHRCLTACRSPRSFIYRHWGRGDARADALRIGLAYGASCVGCCWALMLLMFAVGTANVAWMLGLATVMAVEKNVRGGARLARPVGAGLAAAGILTVIA
jgi:predicted metal-binding membrane protein